MLEVESWTVQLINLMALVSVKSKYQVVIPRNVRKKIGINVGDILEAAVERGKITFTPKSVVDRGIAESIADFKEGHVYGPFETRAELVASLHKEAAKLRAKSPGRKASRT